jgi:hypothetical protein
MPIWENHELRKYLNSQGMPGILGPSSGITMTPHRGTMESTLPYQLGDMFGSAVEDKRLLRPLGSYMSALGSNSGLAALMSGLGLGAVGAGYGLLTDRDPLVWGGIGAGVGGLGGYGLSELIRYMSTKRRADAQRREAMMKYSFYVTDEEDPMTYIQSRLFADQSMDSGSKSRILMTIQQLPMDQLVTLAGLLRTAIGASVGYLISRFLLNMGGVGQGISAGLGGLVGAMFGRGSSLPRNAMGLDVDTGSDIFGRRRLIS